MFQKNHKLLFPETGFLVANLVFGSLIFFAAGGKQNGCDKDADNDRDHDEWG